MGFGAARTKRAEGAFPRTVSVGWGDVHDLLAGPDLEHPGDSAKGRVHHFPIDQVELLSKEDSGFIEPFPPKLPMCPKPDSFPFIRCNLVVAEEDA